MNSKRLHPALSVVAHGESLISTAGAVLMCQTARVTGLDRALSKALARWRAPLAIHDPGKIVADLAIAVALGGDCAADIALVRAQPQVFGLVASDPTVSRLISRLADDEQAAVAAIRAARAAARERAWQHAGVPRPEGLVVIDLDATLITAHSDKQWAAPTWKKTFGLHPLLSNVDHGACGTGEPLVGLLRAGNAGSNTADDHIAVFDDALTQLPAEVSARGADGQRDILVRTDAAGATHRFAEHLAAHGVQFSLGAYLHHFDTARILAELPTHAWYPAIDADDQPREGAWVAEATSIADLSAWPAGTRLILRKERPHPGAQLRFTDADGHRVTGFITNSSGDELAALKLRHRRHARVEDRIRAAKDTGLRNLPFHDAAANQIWLEIAMLAADLIAHTQRLALHGGLRVAEPKRLRLTIFGVAGRIIRTARRHILRIPTTWPWAEAITSAHQRLAALTQPPPVPRHVTAYPRIPKHTRSIRTTTLSGRPCTPVSPTRDGPNRSAIVTHTYERSRLVALEHGPSHRFSDWPNNSVPKVAAAVYTIWDAGRLIYVGMAGRGLAAEDLYAPDEPVKAKGLWTRLNSHASGSGDQFCVYVCDRFVVPHLSVQQQAQIAEGELALDALTRTLIHDRYEYRFITTPDGATAFALEREVQRGALSAGKPFLNPA